MKKRILASHRTRSSNGGFSSSYKVEGDGVAVAIPEKLLQRPKLQEQARMLKESGVAKIKK